MHWCLNLVMLLTSLLSIFIPVLSEGMPFYLVGFLLDLYRVIVSIPSYIPLIDLLTLLSMLPVALLVVYNICCILLLATLTIQLLLDRYSSDRAGKSVSSLMFGFHLIKTLLSSSSQSNHNDPSLAKSSRK